MGKHQIIELIKKHQSFFLCGHINPDGDSIGCQLALAEGLRQLGKNVEIQNHDPVPDYYLKLPGVKNIQVANIPQGTFDVGILIECPDDTRSGFSEIPASVIIGIDHHPGFELETDASWVDTSVAATAQLIFELLNELDCSITPDMATCLYTGLMTDSGSFTYSNTTADSLETGAALMRLGADPVQIAEMAYRSYPAARLQLITDLLSHLMIYCDGQFAVMTMDSETATRKGYYKELFEDLVNFPMSTKEIKVSALGKQGNDGLWRFSMRSKGELDVGAIARKLGGGGHRNAAGFRREGNEISIVDELVGKIEAAFKNLKYEE